MEEWATTHSQWAQSYSRLRDFTKLCPAYETLRFPIVNRFRLRSRLLLIVLLIVGPVFRAASSSAATRTSMFSISIVLFA